MPVRRLGKVLGIIGIVLLLLVVVVASYGAWTVRRSFPQTAGEVTLQGLTGTVDVLRDERGIPHVYADTADDLFFAQGYVHAQDRFYEMDFRRHITARSALGDVRRESQVDTDKFLRVSGWRRVAEKEVPLLLGRDAAQPRQLRRRASTPTSPTTPAPASRSSTPCSALQNPSYTIEPWTPVDSVAWLKAMAWDLRGNMQDEIERSIESSIVGVARTAQLFPPYPYARHRAIVEQGAVVERRVGPAGDRRPAGRRVEGPHDARRRPCRRCCARAPRSPPLDAVLGPNGPGIGSNSWVVSGDKTDTGKPLLANDPHLAPMMPSIWYQMGLHCRTVSAQCPYDVAGFTFSGLPGVIIGHNQTIAWGFTNLGPDVTDLYLEKVVGDTYLVGTTPKPITKRTEIIKVAGGDDVTHHRARDRARPARLRRLRRAHDGRQGRPERARSRRRRAMATPWPCAGRR